jgi:hypothetical protein
MKSWVSADKSELVLFAAIALFLRSELLEFIFDPREPRLRLPPEELQCRSRSLCSSDRALIKLAVDIWCGVGGISVYDWFDLDRELFKRVIQSLSSLGSKPF